jgi:hypothetical protein
MGIEFLTFVVASPKISINFCPFHYIVTNELGTSSYIS